MTYEIVWSLKARNRLQEIWAFVARDKPVAAEKLVTRIIALAELLKENPHLGRVGSEPGIRELILGGTPYLVFYRIRGKQIRITTIWHAAQARKPRPK